MAVSDLSPASRSRHVPGGVADGLDELVQPLALRRGQHARLLVSAGHVDKRHHCPRPGRVCFSSKHVRGILRLVADAVCGRRALLSCRRSTSCRRADRVGVLAAHRPAQGAEEGLSLLASSGVEREKKYALRAQPCGIRLKRGVSKERGQSSLQQTELQQRAEGVVRGGAVRCWS